MIAVTMKPTGERREIDVVPRTFAPWEMVRRHTYEELSALGFFAEAAMEIFAGLIRLATPEGEHLYALHGTHGSHKTDEDEFFARAYPVADSCASRFSEYLIAC